MTASPFFTCSASSIPCRAVSPVVGIAPARLKLPPRGIGATFSAATATNSAEKPPFGLLKL